MGRVSRWAHLKDVALAQYAAGEFYTDLQREMGIPFSTLCRWAHAAGIARTLSISKAIAVGRKPAGARHMGKSCAFHGAKIGWLSADSTYEHARMVQLEADPAVTTVARCETAIPYEFGGKIRSYNPDLIVTLIDGTIRIEEIKPAQFLKHPKTAAKIAAGRAAYGEQFAVITESEIGIDHLKASSDSWLNIQDPEYQDMFRERRKAQRRRAQKRLYRKRRAGLDADGLTAERRYFAGMQAKYRASKRATTRAT